MVEGGRDARARGEGHDLGVPRWTGGRAEDGARPGLRSDGARGARARGRRRVARVRVHRGRTRARPRVRSRGAARCGEDARERDAESNNERCVGSDVARRHRRIVPRSGASWFSFLLIADISIIIVSARHLGADCFTPTRARDGVGVRVGARAARALVRARAIRPASAPRSSPPARVVASSRSRRRDPRVPVPPRRARLRPRPDPGASSPSWTAPRDDPLPAAACARGAAARARRRAGRAAARAR